jgi:hypothetical protein
VNKKKQKNFLFGTVPMKTPVAQNKKLVVGEFEFLLCAQTGRIVGWEKRNPSIYSRFEKSDG